MGVVTTRALVLRRVDFSATSQIVALLTPDLGRVNALAKGSRATYQRPQHSRRIDGPLDTLGLLEVVVYTKRVATDALDLLTAAEVIQSFSDARRDLARWHASLAVAELTLAAAYPRHPDPALFYAAVRSMVELAGPADPGLVFVDFMARWLAAQGRTPDVERCGATGVPLARAAQVVVSVREGRAWVAGAVPPGVAGPRVTMPGIATGVLRRLLAGVDQPLHTLRLPPEVLMPLSLLVQGLAVEVLERRPVSFRYLHRFAPTAPAREPAGAH